MSSTGPPGSAVDWYTAPLAPASIVQSSRFAHGSQVEPSTADLSGTPAVVLSAINVTRWSESASRLIRVR
jgi:hypothetical protein